MGYHHKLQAPGTVLCERYLIGNDHVIPSMTCNQIMIISFGLAFETLLCFC
jgi:hypothetical protein